jgi:hypothetical protein
MLWRDRVRGIEIEPSLYAADFANLVSPASIAHRPGIGAACVSRSYESPIQPAGRGR